MFKYLSAHVMSRSAWVAMAIAMAIFAARPLQAQNDQQVEISGYVRFKAEDDTANVPVRLPNILHVYAERVTDRATVRCFGVAPVSTQSYTYIYGVPDDCVGVDPVIMRISSPGVQNAPSWEVIPPLPQVTFRDDVVDYTRDITVRWPRNPTADERRAWMSVGRTSVREEAFDVAVFAYTAAARDDDYEFLAVAANRTRGSGNAGGGSGVV